MKILIVDDDKDIRDVIGVFLEMDGHEVALAMNYNEALTCVENNKFDLVITDYRMPKMHGLYLLEMLKDIDPNLPVILITAYQTEEMKREARKKSADLILTKPFEYQDLLAGMKKVMRKCRKSDGTKKP